jgi:hypothetical protein
MVRELTLKENGTFAFNVLWAEAVAVAAMKVAAAVIRLSFKLFIFFFLPGIAGPFVSNAYRNAIAVPVGERLVTQ